MSIFDLKRLTNKTFKLDIERMRRGWYSDKYFENIGRMLTALASEGYNYSGTHHNLPAGISPNDIAVGDIEVEMQWFTRRVGNTIVVGVDKSLEMLRHCTGYWEGEKFIDTADKLEVWAAHDGTVVKSHVVIAGPTVIGRNCKFFQFGSIGEIPVRHVNSLVIIKCFSNCYIPHVYILANQMNSVKLGASCPSIFCACAFKDGREFGGLTDMSYQSLQINHKDLV